MKKIIILLCALAFLGIAFAATVTVGTGTATSSYLPFYGLYNYSYSQQIYTQAQINEAGDISKIRFYYVSGTITNNKDWVIYMGHTAKTAFASNTDWEPLANLTQVFAGDVSSMVPSVNNWMEITLSTPFPYNNSDNLVVAVDENTSGYSSMSWGAFTSGTNTGIYYYSDGTNPNPASPPSASSRVALIDRMQFVFPATAAPLAPTLVSPADGGTSFAVGKLTWTPTAGGEDPTDYDVYFGTAATPPLVSSAQTATSYSPTMVVGNTYYWNVVAHNAIGYSSASPTRSFTVVPGVVIGDGTNTSLNLPLNPYYGYNYSQTLYLQSEINISGQRIEKLYYNWNGLAAGTNSKDWTIYMGHTTKTAFASTSDWVPFGDMSQVFSGVVTIPASPGWIEIILTAPFVYNNTENLVIAVNETGSGDDGSAAKFFGTSFAANRGLRVQNDTSAYNPASPGTAYERVAGIANIKMMFGDIPVNGVLVVNPSPVACGSSYVGVQKRVTVSLSNTGGAAFDVSSIALDDLTNFQLGTLPTFPITLNPAAAPVTFDVIFLPTAAGALTANLLIGDNRNPPIVVSGTGVASQVGEICENPYIATLPIVDYAGTTFGFANDYTTAMYTGLTSTLYQNGWDWVAKVTVPTLGALTVNLANPVGNTISQYMAVYLVNTIPSLASPAAVLGQAYASSGPISISNATVSAGDYYIIVDNWATPDGIDFVLNASFESASNPPSPAVLVAPTPTGVTGIAVNPTLSWTTGGGIVEKYFVSYGTQSPLTTIVDNFDNGTATTYSPLPLLAYSTEYWWTVTPWNSVGGNATGVTPWTFTTIPNPTISTFPYTEGFEVAVGTLPANWTVTTGASSSSYNWKAATSAAHGPAAPAVGSSFAWLYCYLASTSNNPYSMITPPIALDATAKRLSYQYWIGDDTVAEPLFVDISTDLATWTTLYTHSNASNTLAWHENMIGLETYASSTVYLRFRGVSSYSNNMTDLAIDNVIVRDTPTGPPDAVTLVSPVDNATDMPKNGFNLTWSPVNTGGTPTSYTVYMASSVESIYEEEAFNGITGTSFNPVTDGLMSFNYEERWFWTVEAVNGDGSAVVDPPFSFTIQADPAVTVPYLENFDALTVGAMPANMTIFGTQPWQAAANIAPHSMPNCAVVYYNSYNDKNEWMITPPIKMVANQLYTISFALKAPGWEGVPEALAMHFGTAPTIAAMTANTPLYDDNNLTQADWTIIQKPFTPSTTGNYYFGWHAYSDADNDYVAVDDISIFIPAALDLAVTGLGGETVGFVGSPVTNTVTIANVGASAISSYTVYLKNAVGDAVLAQETINVALPAAGSADHDLSWTPTTAGTISVYAEVVATGDLVTANNVSAAMDVTVYPASMKLLYVGDPATNWVTSGYPFNMYWEDFVAESVYLASEIQASAGTIKAISYFNNFPTEETKQVQVWMQNTSQADASAGWLPWANYTLVFDGMVHFPVGVNEINIPITPFTYTGGNLAIRTSRTWEGDYETSNHRFYVTEDLGHPNRTRYYSADSEFVDHTAPEAGNTSSYMPNTLFYVDPATLVLTTDTPVVTVSETSGAVNLDWAVIPYAYSYNVYKSADPYAFGTIPETTIYTNTYSYTPLVGETKAFYKVASATYRDYVRGVMAQDYVSKKNAGDLKQVETIQVPKLRNRKTQQ